MSTRNSPYPSDPIGVDRFVAGETFEISNGPVYLLTVLHGGRFFRFSSRPVEVLDEEESSLYVFDGGLDPVDFVDRLDLFSREPSLASVSFRDVVFPVDLAEWEARGVSLDAARGELSLWVPGSAFEARRVLVVGDVVGSGIGAFKEPISFSVEADLYDDRSLLPESSAVVSSLTWADADTSTQGSSYPEIVGSPGHYVEVDGTVTTAPGSRALIISFDEVDEEVDKLLIAGHEVEASAVTIFDDEGTAEVFSVETESDGLGRVVSTVDLSSASADFDRSGGEYSVGWHSGGGRLAQNRDGALTLAGDVLRFYLLRSSLNVDTGRLSAAVDALNAYKVSTYFDKPASAWKFLSELVIPLLPVSFVAGPNGLYPIVWRYNATKADAIGTLTAGRNVLRRGLIEKTRPRREIVNRYRIGWAVDAREKVARRTYVIGPAEGWNKEAGEYRSSYATRSSLRYRHPDGSPFVAEAAVELRAVADAATAARVAGWKMRESAFIPLSGAYEGSFYDLAHYGRGDLLLLVDEELSFEERLVIVESSQLTEGGRIILELSIREDPPRDSAA